MFRGIIKPSSIFTNKPKSIITSQAFVEIGEERNKMVSTVDVARRLGVGLSPNQPRIISSLEAFQQNRIDNGTYVPKPTSELMLIAKGYISSDRGNQE